jgi:transposase
VGLAGSAGGGVVVQDRGQIGLGESAVQCIAPGLMETSITREGIIRTMGAPRKYPDELRERATRMALEALADPDRSHGAIVRVAEQLGVHREALRAWVRKAQAEGQDASSVSADRDARLAQLEKENRELRRANTILKQASAFFASVPQ